MLTKHRAVLEALSGCDRDSPYLNFDNIAKRLSVPMKRAEIRRICRHLARKGWTEYGRGLWNDNGEVAGSGYRITATGKVMLELEKPKAAA